MMPTALLEILLACAADSYHRFYDRLVPLSICAESTEFPVDHLYLSMQKSQFALMAGLDCALVDVH
jgi:hypothetical protein